MIRYFSGIGGHHSEPPAALRAGAHMYAAAILQDVARKRFRFRPPGLKPTTKVGTLGPYRGRLGLAWVIAPLVVAVIIVVAGSFALFR
jgi:hypothetical protein